MEQVGRIVEIWRYPVKSMAGEPIEETRIGEGGVHGDRGWAVRDREDDELRSGRKLPKLMQLSARYADPPGETHVPAAIVTFPDGTSQRADTPEAAKQVSQHLGREVSLCPRRPAEDEAHYALKTPPALSEEALRELFSREPGEPLPDLGASIPRDVLVQLARFATPLGHHFDVLPIHLMTTNSLATLSRLTPEADFAVARFRPNLVIEATVPGDFPEFDWCGQALRIGDVTLDCEVPCVRCGMTTHATAGLPKDPSVLRTVVREAGQNAGAYARVRQAGRVKVGDPVLLGP